MWVAENTRVLEIGCGLAAPSLAAARRGCVVLATDADDRALAWVRRSAEANQLERSVRTAAFDWMNGGATARLKRLVWEMPGVSGRGAHGFGFDVVIGADVLYDAEVAYGVLELLRDVTAASAIALPYRAGADRAERLAVTYGFVSLPLENGSRLLLRDAVC